MVLCVAGYFNPPPHRNQCEGPGILDARAGRFLAPMGEAGGLEIVGTFTVSCKVQPFTFFLFVYAQADG